MGNQTCPLCKDEIADTVLSLRRADDRRFALKQLRYDLDVEDCIMNQYTKLLNERTQLQYHHAYVHDWGLYQQICNEHYNDHCAVTRW